MTPRIGIYKADPSRGGKLKVEVRTDKAGRRVKRWVKRCGVTGRPLPEPKSKKKRSGVEQRFISPKAGRIVSRLAEIETLMHELHEEHGFTRDAARRLRKRFQRLVNQPALSVVRKRGEGEVRRPATRVSKEKPEKGRCGVLGRKIPARGGRGAPKRYLTPKAGLLQTRLQEVETLLDQVHVKHGFTKEAAGAMRKHLQHLVNRPALSLTRKRKPEE